VLAQDPRDLGANVTLGQVDLQLRRYDDAAAAFRVALESEPYNVSAAYNLGVALNRGEHREQAEAAMARFQKLRDSPYKTALSSNYLEQGRYAEAVASTGAEAVDPTTPAVSFAEKPGAIPPEDAARAAAAGGPRAAEATIVLADLDGDGWLDAVVAGGALRVLKGGRAGFTDLTRDAGLPATGALAALAGDYDNDGHDDLLLVRGEGLALLHNDGALHFRDVTGSAGLAGTVARTPSAAFVDADHDGDLDIWAAGRLLQNNGNGTFTDVTERAGLQGAPDALQVVPTDFDNRRDVDLFLLGRDHLALYRNMRDGSFKDVAAELGLASVEGPLRCVAKGDLNKDGFEDFLLSGPRQAVFLMSDGRAGFVVEPAPAAAAAAQAVQFVDYDNDGVLDAFVVGSQGLRLLRNLGSSWADVSEAAFPKDLRSASFAGAALGIADLDHDGDPDAIVATPGRLVFLENHGGNRNASFMLRIQGKVSNRDGLGAKVEIRAGSLRQKLETSDAVPMAAPAELAFGLGARRAPDAVRVIWASGVVQTETELAGPGGGPLVVTELDRKPSSCPFLFAWNGERFEFVTDFLGGGEMGYQEAPGVWNRPDPVESVRIAPGRLVARDGRYELRVTNELEEVLYLDQLELDAIDHPSDVLVFPDEGLSDPPKPERLVAVRDPRVPRAFDDRGRDVSDRLARLDRVFVDELPLERVRGYAREHALSFDLSGLPATHTQLLLTGWTDYAFSSDNVAARQAGLALEPPRLEVERADSTWVTAIADVGLPVGRPQTIVVDLAGRLGPSRRARIVTSMRVYWDQAQVAAPASELRLAPVRLRPLEATLRERGFSAEASPDGREPWGYDYARVSLLSPWKTLPGRYTRTGDVRQLLSASDDRMVVSKPGDELALSFDARSLPAPRAGFARTFLLRGDGFSKEMDLHSASPDVVLPLPFHAMRSYPYEESAVPAAIRRVLKEAGGWNTRTVVRPVVPIELFATNRDGKP
jgi:hypothetical protein